MNISNTINTSISKSSKSQTVKVSPAFVNVDFADDYYADKNAELGKYETDEITDSNLVCASQHCSNSSKKGVKLFPFPLNCAANLIWSNFCRKQSSLSEKRWLCEAHFAADAFTWIEETMELTLDAMPTIFNCNTENSVEPTVLFDLNSTCELCASYDIAINPIDDADLVSQLLTVVYESEKLVACPKCTQTIEKFLLFRRKCITTKNVLSIMTGLNVAYLAQKPDDVKYEGSDDDIKYNEMEAADFSSPAEESDQDTKTLKPLQTKKKKHRPPHVKVTRCLDCDKDYGNNGKLRSHRKICPLKGSELSKKNGPFDCPTCGRVFKTSVGMNVHKHSHDKPATADQPLKLGVPKKKKEPFICHLCGKPSALKTGLEQHLKFHFKIKDFACDKCSKTFYTKSDLHHHLLTHTGLRSFACAACSKTFACRKHLLKHVKIHDDSRRKIHCPHCPKKFFVPFELRVHMTKHTGVKHNVCNINGCSSDFRYTHELRSHQEKVHPKSTSADGLLVPTYEELN